MFYTASLKFSVLPTWLFVFSVNFCSQYSMSSKGSQVLCKDFLRKKLLRFCLE
jgi:hypothetical protein